MDALDILAMDAHAMASGILVNLALGDLVDYRSTTHVGWPREAWLLTVQN